MNISTTPFLDLVSEYHNNLPNQLQKMRDTNSDQSVSTSDWLMVTKVRKHLAAGNQRKAAQYVVMRLEEDPAPLSEWARRAMRMTPLRHGKSEIVFRNDAGEPRAFSFVRASN